MYHNPNELTPADFGHICDGNRGHCAQDCESPKPVKQPLNIGALVLVPYQGAWLGMRCAKGRGLILPGGTYEPDKDPTYQATAIRECQEEVGVIPHDLRYIWHGPDGGAYITFAFLATWYSGQPQASNEGVPQAVEWRDLFASKFGAYYQILYEIIGNR